MLNEAADIHLAGLARLTDADGSFYMPGFVGCLGALEINTLGPLNLIRSDHLSQVRSARNLGPGCVSPAAGAPLEPDRAGRRPATSASPLDSDEADEM